MRLSISYINQNVDQNRQSPRLQGDNLTTNLTPKQFDLAKFESDLIHCDNILIIYSSLSSDLEFYDKLKNKYSNSQLDCYNNLGQPLFHSFINYESIL